MPAARPIHALDHIDWHLVNWARWMRSGDRPAIAAAQWQKVSGSTSFEDMTLDMDRTCARIMDALINDLPPAHNAAINHVYLGTVWRFPRDNIDRLIARAKEMLGPKMNDKGLH